MPAMAPPDMDLDVVDCELAELELNGTFPAVTVVAVTVVSAGVLENVVLAEVEIELKVEVDEGACETWSASTSGIHEIMIPTYRLQ